MLTNMMLVNNSHRWFQYKPTSKTWHNEINNTSKTLKRRYFLVEKAKDVSIVGIIVGTLSIAGFIDTLNRLRRIIEEAGKKSYTFVMGRVTPEKLANYPEIGVFVLVSCPQIALIDSRDYYAPIITPFEAMLAFVPGQDWTGKYSISFNDLLDAPLDIDSGSGVEEPTYSLIQGGYRRDLNNEKAVNIIQKETDNLQLAEGSPLFF